MRRMRGEWERARKTAKAVSRLTTSVSSSRVKVRGRKTSSSLVDDITNAVEVLPPVAFIIAVAMLTMTMVNLVPN